MYSVKIVLVNLHKQSRNIKSCSGLENICMLPASLFAFPLQQNMSTNVLQI